MFTCRWHSPHEAASGLYPQDFIKQFVKENAQALGYEYTVTTNPGNVQAWLQYVNSIPATDLEYRLIIYLRGLEFNPTSYKLCMRLFRELERSFPELRALTEEQLDILDCIYKKGTTHLCKMPKVRLMYPRFLWQVRKQVTLTRREYNDILKCLPITQHHLVWPEFVAFVNEVQCPTLGMAIYERACQLMPHFREGYALFLVDRGLWTQAIKIFGKLCEDEHFLPDEKSKFKNKQEMWLMLCRMITSHPQCVSPYEGERLIRQAVSRAAIAQASLWCALAAYYAGRERSVETCMAVYDEALTSVRTLEDFDVVYNSYVQFLESAVKTLCSDTPVDVPDRKATVDFLIYKVETLEKRRTDLIFTMKLRHQPDSVSIWLDRIRAERSYEKSVKLFEEALSKIDVSSRFATELDALWIEYASLHEANGAKDNARRILERARDAQFKTKEELITVWCESVELELRNDCAKDALDLARRAVSESNTGEPETGKRALKTSVRLWALLYDLETCLGSSTTLAAAVDAMFRNRTITIDEVVSYTRRLQSQGRYEDSFKVYDQAVDLFNWPQVRRIWLLYLTQMVELYKGRFMDRTRRIFEQAIENIPEDEAFRICYLYAKWERDYGLISKSLKILEAATRKVSIPEKMNVYLILIQWTAKYYGLTSTRRIYEEALQSVADEDLVTMGIRFANMEACLLEIERARAILEHVCQYCTSLDDPLWEEWKSLEIKHGDDQTYANMLRKKKAVAFAFSEVAALNQAVEDMSEG